jgi:hypothetical protein
MERFSQGIGAHAERLQKIFPEYLARMNGAHAILKHHHLASMVVHDLNVGRASWRPTKTKSVLIIYADAELSFAVACQSLKTVAGRRSQELPTLK